ncbi:dihydrodipicolinate synthase family protein [Glutamicibacter mysorens]|uniref:dihydrodipicolinate synthase family protein n=1 Tax=Glutamicibacter mysorens TaxID=257984 RepID=UPI0020C71382|nr:dihydrodipicolinate synthase family protein [Glutamicibacter mysorens]UTM47367.1 dihydrodipicolinate synthase family protein [Glutamicibacter mysorens]
MTSPDSTGTVPVTALTGLSAFPLTPLKDGQLDQTAFAGLVQRLVAAGVDSITVLGSTGSYMYLDRAERERVIRLAVQHAAGIPVLAGVGAMRTEHVLAHIDDARAAGAAGVLLAPVGYQRLDDDEVFELFRAATGRSELPVVVYDNPSTTHFTFSNQLYGRIAQLPGIISIKIPGVPADSEKARAHVAAIRAVLPEHVGIGVSGDAFGAAGLIAGCDTWFTAVGGTIPVPMLGITRAVQAGEPAKALALSEDLQPLWELIGQCGSLRVSAAIAERQGLAAPDCLPLPVRGLKPDQRAQLALMLDRLGLASL